MRRLRETHSRLDPQVLPKAHEDHAPAHLRDAVLRREQLRKRNGVAERAVTLHDLAEHLAAGERCEPRYVLDHERAWPEFVGDSERFEE